MYTHTQGRFRIMFLCKVALGATWRVEEAELDTEHIAHNVAAFGRGGPVHSVHGLTVEEVVELYITAIYIYIYIYILFIYRAGRSTTRSRSSTPTRRRSRPT